MELKHQHPSIKHFPAWKHPKFPIELSIKETHIWRLDLDDSYQIIYNFNLILSDQEKMKACKFYFKKDGLCYIITHGALRTILSYYLKIKPNHINFRYNSKGKPFLSKLIDPQNIFFNISHSNNLILFVFAINKRIGVDVEYLEKFPNFEIILSRYIANKEQFRFRPLSKNRLLKAFFNYWTKYEAYHKAIGTGLINSPNICENFLLKNEMTRNVEIEQYSKIIPNWSIHNFIPAPGYLASVAFEGKCNKFRYFHFNQLI